MSRVWGNGRRRKCNAKWSLQRPFGPSTRTYNLAQLQAKLLFAVGRVELTGQPTLWPGQLCLVEAKTLPSNAMTKMKGG
jgi:hypothetical protein